MRFLQSGDTGVYWISQPCKTNHFRQFRWSDINNYSCKLLEIWVKDAPQTKRFCFLFCPGNPHYLIQKGWLRLLDQFVLITDARFKRTYNMLVLFPECSKRMYSVIYRLNKLFLFLFLYLSWKCWYEDNFQILSARPCIILYTLTTVHIPHIMVAYTPHHSNSLECR